MTIIRTLGGGSLGGSATVILLFKDKLVII
jgi:hypothetical protein